MILGDIEKELKDIKDKLDVIQNSDVLSLSAYAAENQYHADKFITSRADWGEWSLTNKSTIASDAGVGESVLAFLYEGKFKSEEGEYYKDQYEAHGGK